MTVEEPLGRFIAENALNAPYRQVRPQTTSEFLRWLSNAGLPLQQGSIIHLWKVGVIRPIAISLPPQSLFGEDRFFPFVCRSSWQPDDGWSIDTGRPVPQGEVVIAARDEGHQYAGNLWWHPFQMWEFERLARILEPHIALDQGLHGAEPSQRLAATVYGDMPSRVEDWANSDERKSWERVLGLLLYTEPLVHLWYSTRVSLPGWGDPDIGAYFGWIESEKAKAVSALEEVGLSLKDAKSWHERLASSATLIDPVACFRTLLRHADRDAKSRLKNEALRADALYEAAEVLRRYLETFHGVELPEEVGSLMATTDTTFNRKLYGGARLLDFDRKVFRRIVRRFGLDPQAKLAWFVEGDTEVGLAKRLAERQGSTLEHMGIDVMNFHGLGGLRSDRTRLLLDRLKNEEVFAYVVVDRDAQGGNDHIRQLRQYARDDLLVGFRAWQPDLEDANFTRAELAQIATRVAKDDGLDLTVTEQDLTNEMTRRHAAIGTATDRFLKRHGCSKWKSEVGGRHLADWALDVDCPAEKAEQGERPIINLWRYLQRAQTSNYWATQQRFYVADDGKLYPRQREALDGDSRVDSKTGG
jgi:hypothetical protein